MSNIVAIVGRPNVGKSTLFNRLTGERAAIVDATSGVTRDRHYGTSDWNGIEFSVIDTGGVIVGSDDILLARLLSFYSQENFPESQAFYSSVGSLKGIHALQRKKGQACCAHLLDMETGEYNLPILEKILSPQKYVVINLWNRRQGLIVKKGNPLGIKGLEGIIGKEAKFINRNEGSGTRVLFEYLLREHGLDQGEITGFSDEVDTHLGVALKVFFNEADVGLGIEYVTHPLNLDFIPLKEEKFDLVVPRELWLTSVMKGFIAYIDSAKIHKFSHNLPGYDLKDTGKIVFQS